MKRFKHHYESAVAILSTHFEGSFHLRIVGLDLAQHRSQHLANQYEQCLPYVHYQRHLRTLNLKYASCSASAQENKSVPPCSIDSERTIKARVLLRPCEINHLSIHRALSPSTRHAVNVASSTPSRIVMPSFRVRSLSARISAQLPTSLETDHYMYITSYSSRGYNSNPGCNEVLQHKFVGVVLFIAIHI